MANPFESKLELTDKAPPAKLTPDFDRSNLIEVADTATPVLPRIHVVCGDGSFAGVAHSKVQAAVLKEQNCPEMNR